MPLLVVGLMLFLGVHAISIVNFQWRDAMAERMGVGLWKGAFSLVAFVGLGLTIIGYGLARQRAVQVYAPPQWLTYVSLLLLVLVFPLLLSAYLPGRFNRVLRHPMLAAVMLWGVAHLLVNGTVADILLFGGFLVWAVADRLSMTWRPDRRIPQAPASAWNDAVALAGGLALYAAFFLGGHAWLIGVPLSA
ncbi:NnrU family protein [Thiohalorhabdus methylotrophus]|uniref:NnrU family protein n=1 Tax=Thiohalorhabdus methylotrophus TaxID=3242694 RepID=A0ABV4TXX5_9GAMM